VVVLGRAVALCWLAVLAAGSAVVPEAASGGSLSVPLGWGSGGIFAAFQLESKEAGASRPYKKPRSAHVFVAGLSSEVLPAAALLAVSWEAPALWGLAGLLQSSFFLVLSLWLALWGLLLGGLVWAPDLPWFWAYPQRMAGSMLNSGLACKLPWPLLREDPSASGFG